MGGKNISTSEQKLGDVNLQTSCYGTCIPIFWGQTRVSPNLVYYTDFTATPHTTTQSGKGGKTSNTTYTYTATIILACGEGPATFIQVYNDKDVGTPASYGFTTFPGTLNQGIWPYLSSNHPSDAYNFSGTVLACEANMALDDSATIGNYSFELNNTNFSIAPGLPGSPDCNPADIVPDFMINPLYGAIPGQVTFNPADLSNFRDYCTASNFFLSPCLDEQKAASDHLKDFCMATNSEMFPSAGQLRIVPYGDQPVVANGVSWVPNTTPEYDLGPDDFIVQNPTDDPIQVKRTNPRETFNCIPVEFLDRANQYNTNTAQVIEPVDAAAFGVRQDTAKELHCIVNFQVAQAISLILAQRSVYLRNEYTFNLAWRYCLLEPMDLLTLTEPKIGFQKKVVRITKVKEDAKGNLQFTCVEWPFGIASATAYSTQSSDVAPVNQLVAPGNTNTPCIFDYPTYLTSTSGAAIGIAASGGPWWGGAQVWMSSDNATYQFAGQIERPGRYGTSTATYGNNGPYDTTHTLAIDDNVANAPQIGSISADYNADFANLALLDNELISYQTATLTGTGTYNLTNIYRGVLGTVEASHASGARFVRMDDATLEIPITPARIGTTLYFKLISYNIFSKSLQSLSDVTPYLYVPNPGWSVSNTSDSFSVNGTVNGIAFTWGLGLLPGAYVVELWEGATAGAYAAGTAVNIWTGNATGKLIAKNDTTTRYYWIHARAADGRYGPVVPSGNGIPGHASFVNSQMVLSATPGTATSSGAPTSQTTNSVAVTVLGGTPTYTYAWSWDSGGSGLTITSSTSASTTFGATGLALHETRTGTAKCVVTDSASNTQTIFVNVEIDESASIPTAKAAPTSVSVTGSAASETTPSTTVTPTGGLAPYTYAWTWSVGGTSITIGSPSSATTTFNNGSMTSGSTLTGTAKCTVTDALGQTCIATVAVSLSRVSTVTVTNSPTSLAITSTSAAQTTGACKATPAGGSTPYTYAWTWLSGGTGISINTATAQSTTFSASGLSASGETRTGTARCTVTDHLGQTGSANVTVSITRTSTLLSATVSPASLTKSANINATVVVTSNPATVSVTGGAPPYSYTWSWAAGGLNMVISLPHGAASQFQANLGPGGAATGTAKCIVTDALSNTKTVTVSVVLKNNGSL